MKSLNQIWAYLSSTEALITMGIVVLYFVLRLLTDYFITKRRLGQRFDAVRTAYIKKLVHYLLALLMLSVIGVVWEISISGLSVYFASFFTVVGVGLFATWSVLSNITASIILFFFFPIKIGSHVRIVDGDNSMEGEVCDLSFFSVRIKRTDGTEVYYPNNLAIQKSIVLLKVNE